MKYCLAALLILASFGFAQWRAKQGSDAYITLQFAGAGQESKIIIKTDPPINKELLLRLEANSGESGVTLIRPSVSNGEHVFKYSFTEAGAWWAWMRYGVGVDTYQTSFRFSLKEDEQTQSFIERFRGDLEESVPAYVQPAGFAILGILLLLSCLIVTSAVRRVASRKHYI